MSTRGNTDPVESYWYGRMDLQRTRRGGNCLECGGQEYYDPDAGDDRGHRFCVDCGAEYGYKV